MAERILVTGATGQLGAYLIRELRKRQVEVAAWSGSRTDHIFDVPAHPVDLADTAKIAAAFRVAKPTTVIHAAAIAAVADCARDPRQADAVNHRGTAVLAKLAADCAARFAFVSTDLVFDGEHSPYREDDPPAPLSVYGRTKAAAESAVLAFADHVVVRVSLLYGPALNERSSFFDNMAASLRAGKPVRLFHDEWRAPIGLATAANALVEIALSNAAGILHVGGPERMSRLEMGQRFADYLRADPSVTESVSRTSVAGEPRPRDTTLDSSRWRRQFPHVPWLRFEESLVEMDLR